MKQLLRKYLSVDQAELDKVKAERDELSQKLKEATELLEEATNTIDEIHLEKQGAYSSVALLEDKLQHDRRDNAVTIACLLSAAGGKVVITPDLIQAMNSVDLKINVIRNENGSTTMSLAEYKEPEFYE